MKLISDSFLSLTQIEQQMKLYAESLQDKLSESEKARNELLESTKSMIAVIVSFLQIC